jgi:hypothetical protein
MDIDPDEFETWKAQPITRWVLDGFMHEADHVRRRFMDRFFYNDEQNQSAAASLRGEFIGLMSMHPNELTFQRILALHELAENEDDNEDIASLIAFTGGKQ